MSHFTVLVIGDDVGGQLAPFHEFECTGQNDEYVQNVDQLNEARAEFVTHGDGRTFAEFCESWYGRKPCFAFEPDLEGAHKYGWMRVTADGDVTELIDRTNPNARWDWWTIGGRWSGSLTLKATGEHVDQAPKGDVDWERMRDEREARDLAKYDKIHAVIAGRPIRSWEDVRAAYPDDIEAARKEWREQPAIRDINAAQDDDVRWSTFSDFDRWLKPRDIVMAEARAEAGVTFALVKDSTWYERGRMGWWACVSDEKATSEWHREFAALIDSLPADTLLTVVDCHI